MTSGTFFAQWLGSMLERASFNHIEILGKAREELRLEVQRGQVEEVGGSNP